METHGLAPLHAYQARAVDAMKAKPGYGLFFDPGMGKTRTVATGIRDLFNITECDAALVIVPIRPMYKVWPAEVAKWGLGLGVSIVHGTEAERIAALQVPAALYLINPEGVAWLAETGYKHLCADVLVVDESHKFKNHNSLRFRALKSLLPRFRRAYVMTGTPAANTLQDLWAQIYLLDQGKRLGRNITAFRKRFCRETAGWGGHTEWILRDGAPAEITAAIADITVRLDACDYLDMPERRDNVIKVELPPAARRTYKEIERQFVTMINDETVTAANAAALSMKLRQIVNGAVYGESGAMNFVHDAKTTALADLVEEQNGQPLLVAVAFRHDIERIRSLFGPIPYLAGGVSLADTDAVIDRWNRGAVPVLLAHPASVSTGLNLQAGGHAVCWFGLTWSLDEYIQMNARVWRQGQTGGVVIHHIVADGTVDEVVLERLRKKDLTQKTLFDAMREHARG